MSKRRRTNTNKMPWFKFYVADYVTAAFNLSLAERGVYVDLLRLFWEYGSLPDDLDKIRVKMMPTGERHHSRINKWIRKVLEQCFRRTDDGRWCHPGFGDHHLSAPTCDKVAPTCDKLVGWEGVLSSEINVPGLQEQNREEQEHTHKSMCGEGKDKKEKPTPDSSDDDAEAMELFRSLADKDLPSRYRSPSPDSSKPPDGGPLNGHGLNGHSPTSPATDGLDHAVATYLAGLANHPKRVTEPDVIRRELAKLLERTSLDVIMAALNYHKTCVWPRKDASWIPTPENFLIKGTWEKDTPRSVLATVEEDHRRRQEEPPQYEEHAGPIRPVDADDEITVLETRLRDDPGLSADERDDLRRQLQDMRQGQIAELNQDLGTERVYR
jgi:hypothetical protein